MYAIIQYDLAWVVNPIIFIIFVQWHFPIHVFDFPFFYSTVENYNYVAQKKSIIEKVW